MKTRKREAPKIFIIVTSLVAVLGVSSGVLAYNLTKDTAVDKEQTISVPSEKPEETKTVKDTSPKPEVRQETVKQPSEPVVEEPSNPYGWSNEDWACIQEMKRVYPIMFSSGGDDRANNFYKRSIVNLNKSGSDYTMCTLYEHMNTVLKMPEGETWKATVIPRILVSHGLMFKDTIDDTVFYQNYKGR